MARLAYLFCIGVVTRHAGFKVVESLHRVESAVNRIYKPGNVALRKHLVDVVAIDTLLPIGVATDAESFVRLSVERMGELVVQRVCLPGEVVSFVTILAEVCVMASLARFVPISGRTCA